jgi:hypothetical protein
MTRKRPRTVWLLTVVFGWSFAKGVELLVRGSSTADRMLYDAVGLGWLAVSLLGVIALLDLAALRYLIKPAPIGRLVCLASIGLSAAQTAIGFVIAHMNPEAARRAFVVSRESRGLPVRPDAIEAALDPTTSLLLLGGSLLVSGLLAMLVLRNREYFFDPLGVASNMPLQPARGTGQTS